MKGASMKIRKIVGLMAASFIAFTMSACSDDSTPEDTTSVESSASETEAPEETETSEQPEASGQTADEACLAMIGPMSEANNAMLESAQSSASDPQTAVNMWSDLANGFEEIATDTVNPEVKAAATTAQADIASVRDAIQKVFVDEDMGAMGEYTTALEEMSESYTALMELCQ